MDIRLRFLSTNDGVRNSRRWAQLAALIFGTIVCLSAHANPPAAPPPIEKHDQASAAPNVNTRLMIPGLPLGPHEPNNSGTRVGFIDSGIDAEHPQLKGLVIAEKDFTGEGPGDDKGHGTIVALRYLQGNLNGAKQLKMAGIFKENEAPPAFGPIISAKVIGMKPASTQEIANRMVKAIRWLSRMQTRLVNISMALPDSAADYTALCEEIEEQEEMLFFIAAGNEGPGSVVYPAACAAEHIMVVGAVTSNGAVADYSGPADIVASGNVDLVTEARFFREEGDRHARTGRFDEAEKVYKQALGANPSSDDTALCQYGLGYIALKRDQRDKALLFFKKSATAWPQYPEPYIAISIILTEGKKFEEAHRWLALGVERGAESARLRDRYARVLLDLDRPVDALKQLDALQQIDPSFKGSAELRLTAQNWSNLLRSLEKGTSPTELLDMLLTMGDDGHLVGFLVRKSGLNPNAVVGENAIPILVRAAAKERYWSCVMLLQLGADVDGRDTKYQVTALMMAAAKGNEKLVRMLLRKGAGFSKQDYLGFTPLMFAAEAGHTPIVKFLIDSGAEPLTQSLEEKTALDYAKKHGHVDVVRLLEDAVAMEYR